MRIKVANLRRTREGIRCDRTSILGNPFRMRSEAERDLVCQAYREYLHLIANKSKEPDQTRKIIAPKLIR